MFILQKAEDSLLRQWNLGDIIKQDYKEQSTKATESILRASILCLVSDFKIVFD